MRRLEFSDESFVYQRYLEVREHFARMKSSDPTGSADPSEYWSEELENIEYLAEASPAVIRKLRHHCHHVTGIRVYDYRSHQEPRRASLAARFEELRTLAGRVSPRRAHQLIHPEPETLGGYGHDIDGGLYNVDTLKFAEIMLGLEKSGILERLLGNDDRNIVWEIGAGWGGFAYQFKRVVPNTTYVIVDLPELFLISATYLSALFPDAVMKFYGERPDDELFDGWEGVDFVFLPNTAMDAFRPPKLDLAINMVSFQEMTTAQVRDYVSAAAKLECPYLYSLNRDKSSHNPQLSHVGELIAESFRVEEIDILPDDYTAAAKPIVRKGKRKRAYHHLVGRAKVASGRAGDPRRSRETVVVNAPDNATRPPAVRVGIGMTLHNNAKYLREALDSLLAQEYREFRLILIDDASSDETPSIIDEYAARDDRIVAVCNPSRLAMVRTWQRAFEVVRRECPEAEYFAWASDHDVWHPKWLGTLVEELDAHRTAVLAYPLTQLVDEQNVQLPRLPIRFDTRGLADTDTRLRHVFRELRGAGSIVYGLYRTDAIERADVFRPVIAPDRLLIAELAFQGELLQVSKELWFRRETGGRSIDRQHRSLFRSPIRSLLARVPWYYQHSASMAWRLLTRRRPDIALTWMQRATLCARFLVTQRRRHRANVLGNSDDAKRIAELEREIESIRRSDTEGGRA